MGRKWKKERRRRRKQSIERRWKHRKWIPWAFIFIKQISCVCVRNWQLLHCLFILSLVVIACCIDAYNFQRNTHIHWHVCVCVCSPIEAVESFLNWSPSYWLLLVRRITNLVQLSTEKLRPTVAQLAISRIARVSRWSANRLVFKWWKLHCQPDSHAIHSRAKAIFYRMTCVLWVIRWTVYKSLLDSMMH